MKEVVASRLRDTGLSGSIPVQLSSNKEKSPNNLHREYTNNSGAGGTKPINIQMSDLFYPSSGLINSHTKIDHLKIKSLPFQSINEKSAHLISPFAPVIRRDDYNESISCDFDCEDAVPNRLPSPITSKVRMPSRKKSDEEIKGGSRNEEKNEETIDFKMKDNLLKENMEDDYNKIEIEEIEEDNSRDKAEKSSINFSTRKSGLFRRKKMRLRTVESSPYKSAKSGSSEKKPDDKDEDSDEGEWSMEDLLDSGVGFEGKSVSVNLRKLVLFTRCILEQPKLVLTFEESLQFGEGIEYNLSYLSKSMPNTSIICISKDTSNLLSYDKIIFLDSGKVLEKGNPAVLLKNPQSYIHRYLKEIDPENLDFLSSKI